MNNPISIVATPKEILIMVVIGLGIVALIAFIVVLVRLAKILGTTHKVLSANELELNNTLKALPNLANELSEAATDIHAITGVANEVVTDAGEIVTKYISPEGRANTLANLANAVTKVVAFIRDVWANRSGQSG